jgi:hypothetical protein
MGAVLDSVKRHVPASYRALVGITNTYYGTTDLQYLADFVQYRLFATVPGAANEATVWTDRKRLELIGILTTLQFIPAAIDYWGDQIASQNLTGTHETNAWFDRRRELWSVFDRLTLEAKELAGEIGVTYGAISMIPQVSYGDNGRNILITPDPALWPRMDSSNSFRELFAWEND